MDGEYETVPKLSNGTISNDLERLSEIFNDKKHRAVSLRHLRFLLITDVLCIERCFHQADIYSCTETLSRLPSLTIEWKWLCRRNVYGTYRIRLSVHPVYGDDVARQFQALV